MKKKNIDLQKKVALNKVTLARLNFEQQDAVRGGITNIECVDTKWCDSRPPFCISLPWPTIQCG
jgi:hypothetical protein